MTGQPPGRGPEGPDDNESAEDETLAGLLASAVRSVARSPEALSAFRHLAPLLRRSAGETEPARGRADERSEKHRGISDDEALVIQAALAAFCHHNKPSWRSVRDVANTLDLDTRAVVALLKAAVERGIVVPIVYLPPEEREVVRLEQALRTRFGLKQVLLVPGLPDILGDLDQARRRNLHSSVIRAMARRVAEYVDALLTEAAARQRSAARAQEAVEPFVLGVAWGRTLSMLAQHFLFTPRDVPALDLHVVPIVGITLAPRAEPVEANIIAMNVARAYGGKSAQLPCPAFLPTAAADAVTRYPDVARMLATIRSADAVITSMGPILETPGDIEIRLHLDPTMNERLARAAREKGAIGEVCYWTFDAQGHEVQTSYRSIGLGYQGLRKLAGDSEADVIMVCGGDKWRFEPLRVALEAGLVSVLISDTVTARFLAGELPASSFPESGQ